MQTQHLQAWLERSDGTRLDFDSRGIIIGRGAGAELQLSSANAPRRLALVFVDTTGVRLAPLAGEPIEINGTPCDPNVGVLALSSGDRLVVHGLSLRVGVRDAGRQGPTGWILRHGRTAFQEIPHVGFRVGGGAADDLRILGWPSGALALLFEDDQLHATGAPGVLLNGEPMAPSVAVELASGDRLGWGEETVQVLELNLGQRGRTSEPAEAPDQIALQPIPHVGGQVTVLVEGKEKTAFLPDRPFRFVLLLLQPPEGWRPGDEIPDTVALSRLWGSEIPMDPQAVSDLFAEVQGGLAQGGIDGGALMERARGRSRFRLAEGTSVVVLRPR